MVDDTLPLFRGLAQPAATPAPAKRRYYYPEYKRSWTRERICADCGKIDQVRRDNPGLRCVPCARAASAEKARTTEGRAARSLNRQIAARGATADGQPLPKPLAVCGNCGVSFLTNAFANQRANNRYCSRACFKAARAVDRACKECGGSFRITISRLSDKTNSSGNFCSRPCYENWLCRTDHEPTRGTRWARIRAEALRRAPFCALCGTVKRLHVHHIVPWRLTKDNQQDNLIPLCAKHHKAAEIAFLEIERDIAPDWATAKLVLGTQLRERQDAIRMKLLEIWRDKTDRRGMGDRTPAPLRAQSACERPRRAEDGAGH